MKILKRILSTTVLMSSLVLATGCKEDSPVTNPPVNNTPTVIDRSGIAKGADVSWLTKMESEGEKFYAPSGEQTECMQLLRDYCGVNAIRLRVWVDPEDGWNNMGDVLIKARRANALGMRVMIDFHFSDTWADPGDQNPPAAWADYDASQMCEAIKDHVSTMMAALARYDIMPEWVQIGNETTPGMLLPLGSVSDNPENFAAFVTTGYYAVKKYFPESKVIVHLDKGNDMWRYTRELEALKRYNGQYDMVGMSLYPDEDNWSTYVDSMITNIETINSTYGKPVMLCEFGMHHSLGELCNNILSNIMQRTANLDFAGIFYWEPEAPSGYNNGYRKGCFENGTPTVALDAFKN